MQNIKEELDTIDYATSEMEMTPGESIGLNINECINTIRISTGRIRDLINTQNPIYPRTPNQANRIQEVYIDGAATSTGLCSYGGVGVYWGPRDPRNISTENNEGKPTNNSSETLALLKCLEQVQLDPRQTIIHCDSSYVINNYKKIESLAAYDFNDRSGLPIPHGHLWNQIYRTHKNIKDKIGIKKIAAHRGNVGNENADRLAKEGMEKNRVNRAIGRRQALTASRD